MAESHNLDLYNCDICMENMLERNPKVLSCLHSFCTECLIKVIKQGVIECPSCRSKTDVPGGDITKLPVNFILLKVKDHCDKVLSSKVILCQFCKATNAILKCQECSQFICDGCSQKHNKLKTFSDHHIYKLCSKHEDCMAAYLCVRCVRSICSTCILMEHSEHEADIKSFTTGIKEILSDIENFKLQLKAKEEVYKEIIQEEEEKVKEASKAEEVLNETIEHLSKRIENTKETLKKVRNFNREESTFIQESAKQQHELEQTNNMLLRLSTEIQNGNLEGYHSARVRVNKLLSRTLSVPEIPESVSVHDPISGKMMTLADFLKHGSIPKVTFMENPELVKTVTCPHQERWTWPWNFSVFDENSVIITDMGRKIVTIAYQTDKPAMKVLVPTGYGDIKDTVVFGDYMYFIFNDCIIQKPKSGGNPELMFKPAVKDMKRCVVVSESCFVLLCDRQVHVFDSNTRTTRKVVANLSNPKSIRLGFPGGKKTFAIANCGTHEVYLYDEDWNKLHTLGGGWGSNDEQFNEPFDTAFTPKGFIVADALNHRLNLFDLKWKFKQKVLDQIHIEGYPIGISFNYPYIWVATNSPVSVKLFRICK